ncbi:MAG: undecaprenyl-diphosphatase UppP [Patescibacteria group bacterium]
MQIIFAILAGIIQGITEFLPISSSGHLIIFHDIFHFNLPDNLLFDVGLHWGTLLALLIFFYKDLEKIIRGFFSSLLNWNLANNFNQRLSWLVIIGSIPAAIVGFLFDKFISDYLHRGVLAGYVTAIALIVVAVLFWVAEKYAVKRLEIGQITKKDSLIMGLAQAIALIPGVSRSGITIIAGLSRKIKREDAARFSFLLSMPVVFGAGVKQLMDINDFSAVDWGLMAIGMTTAVIVGYLTIKYFLKYIGNHSLNVFAWYRLAVGGLMLVWLLLASGR